MSDVKVPTRHPVVGTARGLRLLDAEVARPLGDAPITAIHGDGNDLWVLVGRRDLYRVSGDTTELVASIDTGVATCVGTHAGSVWVGGDDATLWRLVGGRLEPVQTFAEAPTHEQWHTPWGGPPSVFSIASDGSDLYVSVHVGGILRSPDGSSWAPTIDLHDDVHQVAVGENGTIWAATGRRGLAESNDRGGTWRFHTDGLHARYALAVAAVADGALVAVSSGHAARDGAVYRFGTDGMHRCHGLPDDLGGAVGPRQLAAAGDQAVVALPNGDVYTSRDGGREWSRTAQDVTGVTEVMLQPA